MTLERGQNGSSGEESPRGAEFTKNYNSMRAKLQLPEYGRHIQQMVDMLKGIEDRSERNRQAQAVIAVMGNLNPLLRDTADYTHKLWDHLYIMSNFEIDVDSPYPSPSRETLNVKPERLDYSNSRAIRHKHYGKYVSRMLQSLSRCEDREAVAQVVDNIAVYMRAKSFEYNEEHPNNEVILKDLRVLSENAIFIDESAINNIQSDYKSGQTTQSKRLQKSQKMMKGGRNVHQNGSKGGGVDGRSAHNKGRSGQQNRNFVKNNSQRRGQNQ